MIINNIAATQKERHRDEVHLCASVSLCEPRFSKTRVSEQVQVYRGGGGFGAALLPHPHRLFLTLADHGEACDDGHDGHETDAQGANKRLPCEGGRRRKLVRLMA